MATSRFIGSLLSGAGGGNGRAKRPIFTTNRGGVTRRRRCRVEPVECARRRRQLDRGDGRDRAACSRIRGHRPVVVRAASAGSAATGRVARHAGSCGRNLPIHALDGVWVCARRSRRRRQRRRRIRDDAGAAVARQAALHSGSCISAESAPALRSAANSAASAPESRRVRCRCNRPRPVRWRAHELGNSALCRDGRHRRRRADDRGVADRKRNVSGAPTSPGSRKRGVEREDAEHSGIRSGTEDRSRTVLGGRASIMSAPRR